MDSTQPAERDDLLARFDALQERLVPLWEQIGRTDPGSHDLEAPNTIVVIPSTTIDVELDSATQQAYEERMLFLLRQPFVRIVYVSSQPIAASTIDYYLDILPSVSVAQARRRLTLLSPQDACGAPLVDKLLERPRFLERIRASIPDPATAHMVPFLTTDRERALALALGIPMYAADPRFFGLGTKSGCRRVFAEEGVPHPLGMEDLHSRAGLVTAIGLLRGRKPELRRLIVKHNDGVSGWGNASLDLDGLPAPGAPGEREAIDARLDELRFELPTIKPDWYFQELAAKGGIVEERVEGAELRSPSAQLRISPLGEVELLSTHDQMLGGPGGQTFLGARFPADPAYGPMIMAEAEKVGRRFAREGVVGRFAIDFIVRREEDGAWRPFAIETNLRKGGTTHPYLTLQYLTDGHYHAGTGIFHTSRGHEKFYVASDALKSEAYKAFTSDDLFDIVSENRLHYDHTTQTGIVLHMLGAVGSHGKVGLTAIGDSAEDAEALYQRFVDVLDARAKG